MKICSVCGEESPDRARFCIACGTEFEPEHGERFRKVITLLFCDLVDAASLTERLDPMAHSELLTTYYDAMRPIIERHGGTVADFIGDAIMSVFGVPVLHEDDALRACRAALEMRERIVELNVELERRWGVTLALRMGLNTGEVSGVGVARAQNFVAGDAANTAARFQQNAGAGQILFGEATYGLVREGVRVEELEPLTMKGKAGPVRAYGLLCVKEGAEALTRHHDTPFVGRKSELELLDRTYRRVVDERGCALVTILAEAGTGKSRLVQELAVSIGDEALVLRGRCLSYGEGMTFWPVLQIVRELAGIDDGDTAGGALEKLTRIAGLAGEDAIERVASAIGLSTVQFPVHETFWAIRKLLEEAAIQQPLVVVLDDVHWAEPTLLDLIEHLVDTVSDVPLLLICPARHEVLEQRPDWSDRNDITVMHLGPLSEAEVELVIANMLGDVELGHEARRRVVGAAEGNPLFVEQMLSMLVDEGLLRRTRGRLVATVDLAGLHVPASVHALLAARVDRLPSAERAVIEPGAVAGLVFPSDAIEELVPDRIREAVPSQLAALTEKQLVRPESEGGGHSSDYRFNHVLVRDVAYEGVLKASRAALHERFADWTEGDCARRGREAEADEILGYHLEQAHRYRAELGPLDDHGRSLGMRAAKKLAASGRRAFQRNDVRAAANLLDRAAELLPASDRERLELLPDLAEAVNAHGDSARALELLDEVIAGADESEDERLEATAVLVRLFVQGSGEAGWTERLLPAAQRAMAVLERHGDHAGLSRGWRLIASIHSTSAQYSETAKAAQQAVVHSRLAGDRRQELRDRTMYAEALLLGPTPAPEAIAECEQLLEESDGDRRTKAFVLRILAPLQAMQGSFGEARSAYVAARALFDDLGVTILAATVSLESAPVELLAGNLEAAERELQRDFDVLERMGERYTLSTIAALLGQVFYAQGRYDEAAELAERSREIAAEDDVLSQTLWRALRAKLLAREGDEEPALALAHEAIALARTTDSLDTQGDALLDLCEVLRLSGRQCDERAREAAALYERKGNVVAAARARRVFEARADETAVEA